MEEEASAILVDRRHGREQHSKRITGDTDNTTILKEVGRGTRRSRKKMKLQAHYANIEI